VRSDRLRSLARALSSRPCDSSGQQPSWSGSCGARPCSGCRWSWPTPPRCGGWSCPFGTAPLVVVLLLVGRVIRTEAADQVVVLLLVGRVIRTEAADQARPRKAGSSSDVPASPDPQTGESSSSKNLEPSRGVERGELEVLPLLNTGRTNDEIARDLYVARGTRPPLCGSRPRTSP
jgi:hypothetical protein